MGFAWPQDQFVPRNAPRAGRGEGLAQAVRVGRGVRAAGHLPEPGTYGQVTAPRTAGGSTRIAAGRVWTEDFVGYARRPERCVCFRFMLLPECAYKLQI